MSKHAFDVMKKVTLVATSASGWTFRGKTGWGGAGAGEPGGESGLSLGCFVGHVARGDDEYVFVTSNSDRVEPAGRRMSGWIARDIRFAVILCAGILARAVGPAWSLEVIVTERLDLVPAALGSVRAAVEGAGALSSALKARVPSTWPPEYVDDAALQFTIARLEEQPSAAGWWMYFAVARGDSSDGRVLVGTAGFNGPPSADGTVEVGYGIVSEYQRRGFATEAVGGMLAHAFTFPEVSRVIAETLPALEPSIGVLRKCGFRFIGDGSGPGVIRFELARASDGRPGGDRGSGTWGG